MEQYRQQERRDQTALILLSLVALICVAISVVLLVTIRKSDDQDIAAGSSTEEAAIAQEDTEDNEGVAADPVSVNIPVDAVTYNGHSYYIYNNECDSWGKAKGYCIKQGGYLAAIDDSDENEFLYDYMVDSGYDEVFFGYTDQDVEGEWKWINGSDSTFTDWGINESNEREPNGANALENYAHMNMSMRDGHWNDKMFGASSQCFFCEWDIIP